MQCSDESQVQMPKRVQNGTKKVSLRKRVSQLISWEKQRKRIQQHVLCINKQLACLRYLTLFLSMVNYVHPIVPCCFRCLPPSWRIICVKNPCFQQKRLPGFFLHDAGTARQALEMIEEALERNRSKQPRPGNG